MEDEYVHPPSKFPGKSFDELINKINEVINNGNEFREIENLDGFYQFEAQVYKVMKEQDLHPMIVILATQEFSSFRDQIPDYIDGIRMVVEYVVLPTEEEEEETNNNNNEDNNMMDDE
eukprot:TRINITY_DN1143_c0_g1_i1.p1 TRINITY_DN1143_c0_g1~~TRINITY_DN1143_c0_g1_i1.p1  ORF type:complete len:118 (+),score=38.22 TRINITY_DN1143_c0_g1_i1:72-425(+)